DGEYGRRRAECDEAARRLGIRSLRDLTNLADTGSLTDPVLRRRVRHVFTDNQRVLEVVALLRASQGPSPGLSADTYREIGRRLRADRGVGGGEGGGAFEVKGPPPPIAA